MKLFQFVEKISGQKNQPAITSCPSCGYTPDRPHTLYCPRCQTEIPGFSGCTGCGKCKRKT